MLFMVGVLASCGGNRNIASSQDVEPQTCSSTREYVTMLEFLRAEKKFGMSDPEARRIAQEVSEGCTGAAKRVMNVTLLLRKAGMSAKDALAHGKKFIDRSDAESATFIEVFKRAFLEDYLDMELGSSTELAHSLSSEFNGNLELAARDFKKMVEFCVENDGLDLPKATCGRLGARVARQGQNSGRSVYPSFIEAYEFLRSENGPNINLSDAVRHSEELVGISPYAVRNFIQAYRYGISEKGLSLTAAEALRFGKQMATQTTYSGRNTASTSKSKRKR